MKFRIYIAEFFATFQLVFIGTGAIVFAQETGNIGDFGIGFAFGTSVYLGVMLFAKTSGAHMNPAVTFSALLLKKIKLSTAVYLVTTQLVAAFFASLLVKQIAIPDSFLGITQAHVGVGSTWILEFLLTFILVIVVFFVYTKSHFIIALSAGTVVFLEAWLAGPLTGASMNPARSFGPALVSGHLENLWIYLTAPMAAAVAVYYIYKVMSKRC